jgi:hypothetical protein
LIPPRAKLSVENNGMVLRCGVNNLERHAAILLGLNCRLEIRSPPELKTAFQAVAEKALSVAKM